MSDHTVLLVEDNVDNLNIYSTVLRYFGYDVLEARDGETALDLARTQAPAIILMDVSIPLVDGWEATRRLKADQKTSTIPIIALTAHALESDRQTAERVGCDGYIPKPAEPRVVLDAVRKYIGDAKSDLRALA